MYTYSSQLNTDIISHLHVPSTVSTMHTAHNTHILISIFTYNLSVNTCSYYLCTHSVTINICPLILVSTHIVHSHSNGLSHTSNKTYMHIESYYHIYAHNCIQIYTLVPHTHTFFLLHTYSMATHLHIWHIHTWTIFIVT